MASPQNIPSPEANEGCFEDTLKDGFRTPSRPVDAAFSAFTNNEYDLHAKSENCPAYHGSDATIQAAENAIDEEHSSNTGPDPNPPLIAAEQNNCTSTEIIRASMPLPATSFETDPPSVPLKNNSNDPILFTLEDWENISCVADPSASALGTNGISTPGSCQQPSEFHSQRRDDCQPYMTSSRDSPTQLPVHFPVATSPDLIDPYTGRRRSQSVPPQMPTFARRLENGNIRQIGIPTTSLGTIPYHYNTRPHVSYMAQPSLTISRSTTEPYFTAHPSSLDMMTGPSAPTPYAHTEPTVHHRNGPVSCKRSFHQRYEQLSDSDRAQPEPKRRNRRKKTDLPLSLLAGGATGTMQVQSILENIRAMLQNQFEEVRNGRFEELEV